MADTYAYADIITAVQGLAGTTLTAAEKTRLKYSVNRRAYEAFRRFDFWPDFLRVGEKRYVNGADVCLSEPSYVEDETVLIGTPVDTFLRLHAEDPWKTNSVREYQFTVTPDGARMSNYTRAYGVPFDEDYDLRNQEVSASNILNGGGIYQITLYAGAAGKAALPAPVRIGDFVKITSVVTEGIDDPTGPWEIDSATTGLLFTALAPENINYIDHGGGDVEFPIVYATYKRRLTETYGDGAGETATIPRYWHGYLIQAVYADFLRGEGQVGKAIAEDQMARELLNEEVIRLEAHNIHPAVNTRISTHGSRQARGV